MDLAAVFRLVFLGLAALFSVRTVVRYLRAGHHLGTTMGEEMDFGQGWGLSALYLGVGLLGLVPWWAAIAAPVGWYLLSLPLRPALGWLALALGTPARSAGDEEPRRPRRLPG